MQVKTEPNQPQTILAPALWSELFCCADELAVNIDRQKTQRTLNADTHLVIQSRGDSAVIQHYLETGNTMQNPVITRLADNVDSIIGLAMDWNPEVLSQQIKAASHDIKRGNYSLPAKIAAQLAQWGEELSSKSDPARTARVLHGILGAASSDYLNAAVAVNILRSIDKNTGARTVLTQPRPQAQPQQSDGEVIFMDLRVPNSEKAA